MPIKSGFIEPDELEALAGEPPREGWDPVVSWKPGVPPDEFADVGVTWLVQSVWPKDDDWVDELRSLATPPPSA